ncbi:hypothetical protein DMN91_007844 [Ooceraea biroi]|uniref:Uncharacterized protein n=1 Tax=Ooceraea biroi TaxID=2015173 RepID=A0A3L8DFQ1_OOCBI|nr:hypothetical protein DMN91_007844 [Ooceraea biroi]
MDLFLGSAAYPMQQSVGIEVRVTNEIPVLSTETNVVRDAAQPWTTTSAPSQTTPPTPTNPQLHYLSPHVLHGRNSLCSANDYTRRRRPMTLRIGPRLSLPSRSTSAPTTTTDGEWRALSESGPHPGIPGYGNVPGGHLWGKRNQGRTSAPVVGHARPPAIILRTRRSWPVAPTHCRRRARAERITKRHYLYFNAESFLGQDSSPHCIRSTAYRRKPSR